MINNELLALNTIGKAICHYMDLKYKMYTTGVDLLQTALCQV